jgi:hypothetical protein
MSFTSLLNLVKLALLLKRDRWHLLNYLYNFVHDGMLFLGQYIIHSLICCKADKTETTLPARIFVNNDLQNEWL